MMTGITEVLKKKIVISKTGERIFLITFFAFLTFAGAMIRIPLPFTPVPITLQTFILFMAVYYLKPKDTGISQSIYILAGLIGAPVFAAGLTGALALIGPTAGYLIGFVVSGVFMAWVLRKVVKLTYLKTVLIFFTGALIILTLGVLHLYLIYNIPFGKAVLIGFLPFVAGDAVKVAVAASFFKLKR